MSWPQIFQLAISIIGSVALPLCFWLMAKAGANKKELEFKDGEIDRLREKRDSEAFEENDNAHKELSRLCEALRTTCERLGQALYDLEIKISQQYATTIALGNTEKRFFDGMARLEGKLDRILEARAK